VRYGSVCSGIEAATAAWHPLGWEPAFFSEIEAFPSAVLAHHYPDAPNLGDMTKYKDWPDANINVLVGGTPCQSFSVAGLRKGLDDPRGNLMLTFGAIAAKYRPQWLVWENVPGVLSSNGGRDFGSFLGLLGELGYGFAYRVLDAQYVGLAQRRKRVFVVGCLGDWRGAAAVLFERHSLSGHPAPRREKGKVAPTIPARSTGVGGLGTDFDCDGGLISMAHGQGGAEIAHNMGPTLTCNHEAPIVAHTLRAKYNASEDGTGRGTPIVPVAFGWQNSPSQGDSVIESVSPTLDKSKKPAVAMPINTQIATRSEKMGEGTGFGIGDDGDPAFTLQAAHSHGVFSSMQVRRLTPVECERLQGFPDKYTAIPYRNKPVEKCPDGPRYKALGNSMAVPVMGWIGSRIQRYEDVCAEAVEVVAGMAVGEAQA